MQISSNEIYLNLKFNILKKVQMKKYQQFHKILITIMQVNKIISI